MRRSALAVLAFMIGCGSIDGPSSEVGHYELETVGGHRLPIPSSLGPVYWGGSLELRADSSFVDVLTLGDDQRPTVVDSVFGRYRLDGDSIRMTPTNWDQQYALSRQGSTVSALWAEGLFVYRR